MTDRARRVRSGRLRAILSAMDYAEAFDDLANVYLEDSWVLEVAPARSGIAFRLEAVLTPGHARYEIPTSGEQHCYRDAWLEINSATSAQIDLSGAPAAGDANETQDLGNIDGFVQQQDGERWMLEGDWGRAKVQAPSVKLLFI